LKRFNLILLGLFACSGFVRGALSADVNCGPGYGYDPEDGCIKCDAGWYSPGGSSVCVKCGGGKYSSSAGSPGCSKCAPGTYAPEPDPDDVEDVNTSCHPCPNGKFMDEEGAIDCKPCMTDENGTVLSAPYVSPDKTRCEACPPGNCCYRYIAHVCKKGTYAEGDVACRSAFAQEQQACNNRSGVCIPMPSIGVIKGGCTRCDAGWTTVGLGAIMGDHSVAEGCSVRSASSFRGVGGTFSWPDDGSVSEQEITSPYVNFVQ